MKGVHSGYIYKNQNKKMETFEIGRINTQKLSTKIMHLATLNKSKLNKDEKLPAEIPKKYKRKERKLTQEQIEVFRQAFQIFDQNRSGSIDEEQLASLLNALGYKYDEVEIHRILEEVDKDGSGVIEVNQFIEFMSKQILDTQNIKKQIGKVFNHFDDDNSGFLDFKKMKAMVGDCFFNLDDDSLLNMIAAADTDGDGRISEYEFFRVMKKSKLI